MNIFLTGLFLNVLKCLMLFQNKKRDFRRKNTTLAPRRVLVLIQVGFASPRGVFYLNLTPMRASNARRLALRAMLRLCRNARGATLLASLESKLSDSAALRYLRRRTHCVLRRKGRKSFLHRRKRKIRNTQMGIPYFWRSVWDVN